MLGLTERLRQVRQYVKQTDARLFGDRVTDLAVLSGLFGVYGMLHRPSQNPWIFLAEAMTGGFLAISSGLVLCLTEGGRCTVNTYKKARKRIIEGRDLDKFARAVVKRGNSWDSSFVGYCQVQGFYLACSELDRMDLYNSVIVDSKVKIPHF